MRPAGKRALVLTVTAAVVLAGVTPFVALTSAADGVETTQTPGSIEAAPGDIVQFRVDINATGYNGTTLGVSLPQGWDIVSQSEPASVYNDSEQRWAWDSGGTRTLTYNVSVPSTAADGNYSVVANASAYSSSVVDSTSSTVVVDSGTAGTTTTNLTFATWLSDNVDPENPMTTSNMVTLNSSANLTLTNGSTYRFAVYRNGEYRFTLAATEEDTVPAGQRFSLGLHTPDGTPADTPSLLWFANGQTTEIGLSVTNGTIPAETGQANYSVRLRTDTGASVDATGTRPLLFNYTGRLRTVTVDGNETLTVPADTLPAGTSASLTLYDPSAEYPGQNGTFQTNAALPYDSATGSYRRTVDSMGLPNGTYAYNVGFATTVGATINVGTPKTERNITIGTVSDGSGTNDSSSTAPTVTGTVSEPDGTPAAEDHIVFVSRADSAKGATDSQGNFSVSLTDGVSYEWKYYQSATGPTPPADGVPDFYPFGSYTADGTDTLSRRLPTGHNLTVRVVRPDGTLVENATVNFHQYRNGANAGASVDAGSDGMATLELSGDIDVYVEPPDGASLARNDTHVSVDQDRTVTVTLSPAVPVNGTVTDVRGDPAHGIHVAYHTDEHGQSDFTGSAGDYSLDLPDNRTYHVDLRQSGGLTPFADDGVPGAYVYGFVNVSGATTEDIHLPYGYDVQVEVVDTNGVPIPNASVDFSHVRDGRVSTVRGQTTSDGLFVPVGASDPGIEANGHVKVRARAEGYTENETDVQIDQNGSVTVVLAEGQSVTGRVVGADGTPASEDRVSFRSRDSYDSTTVFTDADGNVTATLTPDTQYNVKFVQTGGTGQYRPTFPADGIPDIYALGPINSSNDLGRIELPDPHNLTVVVKNEQGDRLSNVTVNLVHHPNDDVYAGTGTPTDANGEVRVEAVGPLHVGVDPQGNTYAQTDTDLTLTGDREVTLVVPRRANVTGQVTYANGTAPAGYQVRADGPTRNGDMLASDGSFTLGVATNETYDLVYRQTDGRAPRANYPTDGNPDIYPLGTVSVGADDVSLQPRRLPTAHRLNVTLVDGNGDPVSGVDIYLEQTRNGAHASVAGETNAAGELVLDTATSPGIEVNGTVQVHVRPGDSGLGFADVDREVTVTSDQTLRLKLSETVPVTGTLEYHDGTPVTGYRAETFGDGGDSEETRINGSFELGVLPNREYDLAYKQTDFSDSGEPNFPKDGRPDVYAFESVEVRDSGINVGTKRLPPAHLVNVTVVNGSGEPVSGLDVDIVPINGNASAHHPAHTNAAGEVVLDGASAPGIEANGTLRVHVAATSRYGSNRTTLDVQRDRNVTLVVREPAHITGRTVYPDSSTHEGDTVVTFGSETGGKSNTYVTGTDANGNFTLLAPHASGVDVQFYQFETGDANATLRDGVVDLYSVKQVDTTDGDVALGNVSIPEGYVVNVTVVDADGDPVEGATASVSHIAGPFGDPSVADGGTQALATRADGLLYWHLNSEWSAVPGIELRGNVSIDVRPPENATRFVDREYTRNLTDVSGKRNVTIRLEEKTVVSGHLKDTDGNALVDDWVVLRGANGSSWVPTRTDAEGNFSASVSQNTTYSVFYGQRNATSTGFPRDGVTDLYELEVVDTGDHGVDLGNRTIPDAAGVLRVRVTDTNGDPVTDARIRVYPNQQGGPRSGGWAESTDGSGYWLPDGVEATGNYTVRVDPPENSTRFENRTYTRNVTVTADTQVNVTLAPQTTTEPSISGRILGPDGEPVGSSGRVILLNETGFYFADIAADGTFSRDLPHNGSYHVMAYPDNVTAHNGIADAEYLGAVTVNGPTNISTHRMEVGHLLNVNVVDQYGEPVEDARVGFQLLVTEVNNNTLHVGRFIESNAEGDASHYNVTGVELNGSVDVRVKQPANSTAFRNQTLWRNVTVTQNDTLTFTLQRREPSFNVSYGVASTTVPDGDPVNVTATVTNTGNATGTKTVTMTVTQQAAPVTTLRRNVTLDPGEKTTVTFSESLDLGTYDVRVDDLDPTIVTVTPGVDVSVHLTDHQAGVGGNLTAQVVVHNVTNGVGTFDVTVTAGNATVATVTDATVVPDATLSDTTIASDGSNVRINAANATATKTGSVVIATVTVNASAVGDSGLGVTVTSVGNQDGDDYYVRSTTNTSLSVVPVPAVGNKSHRPTDLDGDGTFEDVNGDGDLTLSDVQTLFNNMDSDVVQEYAEAFDFNGNGKLDIVDVQALYNAATEGN